MSSPAPASAIADVLALRGADGWLTPPLRTVAPPPAPVAGKVRLVTIDYAPTGPGFGQLYELLSNPLDGHFVVVAGARSVPGAVWGELLAFAAQRHGALGVLIDGSARDRCALLQIGLPIYARDEQVVGPAGMAHVRAIDEAVDIGGTIIEPGDTVVGDESGCVRVRAAVADEVLAGAHRYAAAEAQVFEAMRAGAALTDAYHYKSTVVAELRG